LRARALAVSSEAASAVSDSAAPPQAATVKVPTDAVAAAKNLRREIGFD
jgi:hypothetical protein